MVDQKAKNISNDESSHNDDITALTISSDRKYIATGQVGPAPSIFVWDSQTA